MSTIATSNAHYIDVQDSPRPHHQPPAHFRPIANPAVLGLCAFATTTFVLSMFNAEILHKPAEPVIVALAFFYGGFVQIVAGVWEYTHNNAFGATAFCSYGAFWMSFAYYVQFVAHAGLIPKEELHNSTGVFLLTWTIFTMIMLIASFRTNVGLFVTFFVLEITFILLTIGNFKNNSRVIKAGGWMGIITAFCAWFCALSVLLKATWKQDVLPLRSLSKFE